MVGAALAWGALIVYGLRETMPGAVKLYSQVWKSTRPIYWILHILVVIELFVELFRPFSGIERLGRCFCA